MDLVTHSLKALVQELLIFSTPLPLVLHTFMCTIYPIRTLVLQSPPVIFMDTVTPSFSNIYLTLARRFSLFGLLTSENLSEI